MRTMIRRVNVHTIPARWKNDRSADSSRAGLVRELGSVIAIAGCTTATRDSLALLETTVADSEWSLTVLCAERGISSEHAEALRNVSSFGEDGETSFLTGLMAVIFMVLVPENGRM